MSLDLDRSTWRRVKFGDVVRQCKESTDPAADGVERYVAGEHMDTDNLKISRWGEVGDGYLGPAFHRKFKSGQVLYGSRRTYLRKVALADFDGVCANTTFVMESADPAVLLPELLPFIMSAETFHAHSIAESKGSVNPYVNWPDIAKYEFDLPSLADQRRIADLLWGVEQHKRMLIALQVSAGRAAQTVRDDWFSGTTARLEYFESLCLLPSQNGLSKTKADRAGSVPMVNMGQMFQGEVIPEGGYERVALTDKERSAYVLRQGDLLFARRSIVFEGAGAACLVPALSEDHTFESSVIRVSPDQGRVRAEYLLHYFRSRNGREQMSTIVRRGPVSGIAGSDLRKLRVPVDSLAQQDQLIRMMSRAQSVEEDIRRELAAATSLANSALASILTPALVVIS